MQITVDRFKELCKAQNEDFETSAFEFEKKTIENVINDLKTSFNLASLEEDEQANSNFKTGRIWWRFGNLKCTCMGNTCWK